MAPELTQRKKADERTDLYALGVLAFRTLTGRLPFEGDTAFQVLSHHVSTIPPSLCEIEPSLPIEVEACVLQALAKEPAARYRTVGELIEALQRVPAHANAAGSVSTPPHSDSVPDVTDTESLQATQRVDDASGASVDARARADPSRTRVAAIGIAGVAMATALAFWVWPGRDSVPDGAEEASVAPTSQPSAAADAADASSISAVAMPGVTPPEPDEPEPEPEPSTEPPPPVTPSADTPVDDTSPDRETQPPRPPRGDDPKRGSKPRSGPPPDDVVVTRVARKANARCEIESETLHVTCALGGDGRVLSVSIEGGTSEQRACVRNVAKRARYAPGRARIVEIDVRS
jgi:serine/threonine-protein kinase